MKVLEKPDPAHGWCRWCIDEVGLDNANECTHSVKHRDGRTTHWQYCCKDHIDNAKEWIEENF